MTVRLASTFFAALFVFGSNAALAWDGVKSGKITGVDVTNAQNFAVRVYLDGAPICGTTENWAYINKDYDNFDAMVAAINSAFMSGKQVTIYANRVGDYCSIGYLAMR